MTSESSARRVIARSGSPRRRTAPLTATRARLAGMRGLTYLIVLGVVLIYVFPLLFLVNTAFKRPDEFVRDPGAIAHGVALQNFVDAWSRGGFGNLIVNSLVYAVVSAGIAVILSVLIAFPVARGYVRFSRVVGVLFALALFLPNSIVSQFQLMLQLGLYNTRIGFILISTAGLGIGPLLIVGYLRTLPRELDEAAAMDGCGYFRYIWSFVLPLCRPVLTTVFILQTIGVWNDIIGPTIYLSSPQLQTVAQGLLSFYGQNGNNQWALLAAATLMIAAPLIVLYIVFQRFFVAGATNGALR
ncbi:carbohydrate ABC transporter permease [Leifsonia sp. TF02-11]|uniref:carbohydrate ABC transporter permease n=1 Tax=Leifsonia sp. TF02-11 TaxID=2815212 RepID=UPI0027DC27A3|nr:carbohydrate ABC transporter permease [Leifsonia sp. TF02-11]